MDYRIKWKVSYNKPILGSDGLYHYIYCWINMNTQWCYVGKHNSTNELNSEGYRGSSGNLHYWNSMKCHEFKCIILQYVESSNELNELEKLILSSEFIKEFSENGIFNLNTGGKGSWDYCNSNPDIREKADHTNISNHGGRRAIHTEKSYNTNMDNHSGCLAFNSKEAHDKSMATREKLYGGSMARCNTEDVINAKINKYGDSMGMCHTEEVRKKIADTTLKRYGEFFPNAHTEEALRKGVLTKYIRAFIKTCMKMLNNGLSEFNEFNYCSNKFNQSPKYNELNKILKSDRASEVIDYILKFSSIDPTIQSMI